MRDEVADLPERTLSVESARPAGDAPVPVLHVALEGARPAALSARYSLAGVERVTIGRGAERTATFHRDDAGRPALAITIPDPRMSTRHAVLERELGRWVVADAGSKNGTFVDDQPIERLAIGDGARVETGHTVFVLRRRALPAGTPAAVDARDLPPEPRGLATLDPDLAHDFDQLRRVAPSTAPVLVGGETGTGKELVARAVHALSGRRGELVAVNCGALPGELVEAELFGVKKGAFTGAVEDRPGIVRRAAGGTLFLDEIGALAAPAQAALLRVLQDHTVTALGDTRPIAVDFRVVCATLDDLDARAAAGGFRPDLLARIDGFRIELPPLRERLDELGSIIGGVLVGLVPAGRAPVELATDAMRAIVRHDWPGNIRELEKCLETALALAGDGPIERSHLPAAVRAVTDRPPGAPDALSADDRVRRDELIALLRSHGGNISAVARHLGKARMQVQRWIRRFRIDPDQFRV
jgi:DNA-binding NtrC family response regulator